MFLVQEREGKSWKQKLLSLRAYEIRKEFTGADPVEESVKCLEAYVRERLSQEFGSTLFIRVTSMWQFCDERGVSKVDKLFFMKLMLMIFERISSEDAWLDKRSKGYYIVISRSFAERIASGELHDFFVSKGIEVLSEGARGNEC